MTKNTTTLKNIPTNDVCYLSDEHLDKILSGIDTSGYPKFNNPSECVYYMQMTGMSLGDFLKDCANRAKEHYFDTVTGKDLKRLEEIQSSIRENCEAINGLREVFEEVVDDDDESGESDECGCPCDEHPEYDDSDFEYYDALEEAGYDDFGFSWVEYHIN